MSTCQKIGRYSSYEEVSRLAFVKRAIALGWEPSMRTVQARTDFQFYRPDQHTASIRVHFPLSGNDPVFTVANLGSTRSEETALQWLERAAAQNLTIVRTGGVS